MPQDLSLLDQLEEWLEAQVPTNLHDLPYRMLESMERISNEIFETLNMHGPPSISIPFPPFGKQPPPPPPPPPPSFACRPFTGSYTKVEKLVKAHPYAVAGGAALVLSVGLGVGGMMYKKGIRVGGRRSVRGVTSEGMLKEAIVILSPSPMPPLLWPLTISLLRAGYVVVVAVPHVEDAEQLEKRLSGLEEKNALRVLIYDPEEPSTFPPFHRSLLATLTLRFPALNVHGQATSDPYNPSPNHIPQIHAFVSLYPLNPAPPSRPGALPALPSLLTQNSLGKTPKLITLYPSTSTLVQPDSFANQILTANHQLLGRNLGAFSDARAISVYVGDVHLPLLQTLVLGGGQQVSRRQQARQALAEAATAKKASIIKDFVFGYFANIYTRIAAYTGVGSAGREYALFESSFLRVVRRDYHARTRYHLGQYSYLSLFLSRLPAWTLPRLLTILPILPTASGPLSETVQGLPAPQKPLGSAASSTGPRGPRQPGAARSNASAESSEHEHELDTEADMVSSFLTTGTSSSRGNAADAGSESSAPSDEGRGLGDSWVGLDGESQ